MTKYTYRTIIVALFVSLQAGAQGWQWGKANSGAFVEGWPVSVDKAGNVFAAGVKLDNGYAAFSPVPVPCNVPGGLQCILTKYDASGNFLWAQGTINGPADLISMTTDPFGNAYMLGRLAQSTYTKIGNITLTNATADNQYFLVKFDPSGNVLWALNEGNAQTPTTSAIMGMAYMLGMGNVATDDAGNVYVVVNFHTSAVTVGGHTVINTTGATNDVLVVKYGPSGNVIWARGFGGTANDEAYALTVTHAGDVYIAGIFGSPTVTFGTSLLVNSSAAKTTFIARFDASGNPVWAASSGGNGREYASGLASDAGNNVYMTGGFFADTLNFNSTVITNQDMLPALYLVKINPFNHVDWFKTISSSGWNGKCYGYSVTTSACGEVWVAGAVNKRDSAYKIFVDDGSITVTPSVSDPLLIAGFTTGGHFVGGSTLQSGGDDQVGIAADAHSNIYVVSDYDGKNSFTVGNSAFPLEPSHEEYMYLARFSPRDPVSLFRHTDTTMCFKNGLVLSATKGYGEYTWNDGRKGQTLTVADTGIFWVRAQDSCVSYMSDTFRVSAVCDCINTLFVPNTFTPNGDGQNDLFYPRSGTGINLINSFRVYNRWGALLFERENIVPNDPTNGWDGSFQGSLPLPDVYVYIVEVVCENGKTINKKGSVTVVR